METRNLRSEATIDMKYQECIDYINKSKNLILNYSDKKIRNKYFITIRKHQTTDQVLVVDIMKVLRILRNNLQSLKLCYNVYEVDKKYNQLHFHAIVNIDQYFKYNKLLSIDGFRLYWKPVYDINRLISYMQKQSQTAEEEESRIIINKYTHKKSLNYFQ